MKTFEEFINEGKPKVGTGSTSIDLEFGDFDDPEVAKDLKKYRLKAKRSKSFSPYGGHESIVLTGAKKDLLAYITSKRSMCRRYEKHIAELENNRDYWRESCMSAQQHRDGANAKLKEFETRAEAAEAKLAAALQWRNKSR